MNKPAAISGTFVKIEPVATRKVVRLHIECPIEEANQILAALGGYPDAANPSHVAVARLSPSTEAIPPGDKWKPERINVAQEAALTCQKPEFWRFLREERKGFDVKSEEAAADYVRTFCGVGSRADIGKFPRTRERWHFLLSAFNAWMEPQP